MMAIDLVVVWAMLIALAVLFYVVLDGFDLGVGILCPLVRGDRRRDTMLNSIAPVWDGNETWLVFGGGGLMAVFPLAYSLLLTAFYAPLVVMLLALVFRGVAFEFRHRDPRHKAFWTAAFSGGSLIATLAQGIVLGAFVQGVAVEGRSYAGGWFDWLTPFSLLTGVGLVVGYALLGASWLVMKTDGALRQRMYRMLPAVLLLTLVAIAAVSLATPVLDQRIAARWFSWPNLALLSPVPLAVAGLAAGLLWAVRVRRQVLPFLLSLGLFVLSYLGLGISLFPYIVPPRIDIWQAAAPESSLSFLLVGALILLPIILGYTAYNYWVFRGKVAADDGYH